MPFLVASTALPWLRRMDPERAHALALTALRFGLAGRAARFAAPALAVEAMGLHFPNPIGLAAGFDKNAVALQGLARLGFGFVETGTVTPRPQPGNPRPRLFRLEADRAVINRMGFNNNGIAPFVRRLARRPRGQVPIGANVGINKEGAAPEHDYPALVRAVAPFADYAVINVSSPNTPGLRDLQGDARLTAVLQAVAEVSERPPILVKIAPDLSKDGLAALVETCLAHGVQGLIVSNTTISRPEGLKSPESGETGGLSGAPLFRPSTAMLARAYRLARGRLVLIGAGGVFSGQDALTKIRAGATLVQLYTSFAYEGPALVTRIREELMAALQASGFARIGDAVGVDSEEMANW
jgi:dihydroorotate dehydrogenase